MVVDTISGPESMATAHATVRPGGTIACLGMDHFMGKTPSVNWFDQFLRNISVTGGLVPGKRYLPELVGLVESGPLDPAPMLSHTLDLEEAAEGYRLMADRADGVTKVALRPGGVSVAGAPRGGRPGRTSPPRSSACSRRPARGSRRRSRPSTWTWSAGWSTTCVGEAPAVGGRDRAAGPGRA